MNNIIKAVQFATLVHKGQTRKGKPNVPYVTHPLTVGLILSRSGSDEDIVIAGILHDTIEDCKPYGSITKEIIAKEFSDAVAEMVNDVTEQDKSLPWPVRKQKALDHIPYMKKDSLFVKSADVLHNMSEMLIDYKIKGDDLFKQFNEQSSKEMQLERYKKLVSALEKAWKGNPLLSEIMQLLEQINQLWSSK